MRICKAHCVKGFEHGNETSVKKTVKTVILTHFFFFTILKSSHMVAYMFWLDIYFGCFLPESVILTGIHKGEDEPCHSSLPVLSEEQKCSMQ